MVHQPQTEGGQPVGVPERPNILLILTDQQARATFGACGNRHIRTPHLDRLAAGGVCFTLFPPGRSAWTCFDEVAATTAPIRMVANGRPDEEFVPMIVPGGSVCLYSIYTRDAASEFAGTSGHRPVTRKDRPWDGARTSTYKSGAGSEAMRRFLVEATPRQRELLGFPPPGDPLWTERFTAAMATRYPGFDPASYDSARAS